MTPEKFLAQVKETIKAPSDNDVEYDHMETDRLMEEALITLGYAEGIEFIRNNTRWYS